MTDTISDAPVGEGTLVTYFQPFYNLQTEALQGFEALARQVLPDGTVHAPTRMLATAEATGEMRDLDLRTLEDALAFKVAFRERHPDHSAIVSINLSWDLATSPLLVTEVGAARRRHGVGGDRVLLDVSSAIFRRLLDSDAQAFRRLGELQTQGIALCLDGFTAEDLDLLPSACAVPIDIIKLHPLLVAQDDRVPLAQVATAVQETGLPVVAAGVENAEELARVRDLGFEWAQGFHVGEPRDADAALQAPLSLAGS